MEYNEKFERTFIERTLAIVDQYEIHVKNCVPQDQQFEVTLLVNCLLGLLVLPKEWFYDNIPTKPIEELQEWGLSPDFIIQWGKSKELHHLRYFVCKLRNAVAHGRISLQGNDGKITSLEFIDRTRDERGEGFRAVVPIDNLKTFVRKLVRSVEP